MASCKQSLLTRQSGPVLLVDSRARAYRAKKEVARCTSDSDNLLREFSMRKTIVIFLSFIALVIPATSTSAAPKLGGNCKNINEKITAKKIRLVCQQTNNRLIWRDSKTISTPAFGPTGRLRYRYLDGKLERLSSANDWLRSDSRKVSEFDPIRVKAFNSLNAVANDSSLKNVEFKYFIQSNYPKVLAEYVKSQTIRTAQKLSTIFDKRITLKLILLTEKDLDFINKELPSIIPQEEIEGFRGSLERYDTKDRFFSSSGTGGGTATYRPDLGYAYYLSHTSTLATPLTYWPEIAPHELAHVIQGTLANGFEWADANGDPNAKWTRHFVEGSANTIGMAWGFEKIGWYSDEMDHLLKTTIQNGRSENYSTFDSQFPMKTVDDAYNLIYKIEGFNGRFVQELSYSAGQMVWEYFIGTYGADKYFELLRSFPNTKTFDESLKMTIGKSKEDFYREAAPYLLKTWERVAS